MATYAEILATIAAQQKAQEDLAAQSQRAQLAQLQSDYDQSNNTLAAQEAQQRANYQALNNQADQKLKETGSSAYQSMLVAKNPFGTQAERLRNNGMSDYLQGAAYNTYRGDINNATGTRDTTVNSNNLSLQNGLSDLNASRLNLLSKLSASKSSVAQTYAEKLADLLAQYNQLKLNYMPVTTTKKSSSSSRSSTSSNGALSDSTESISEADKVKNAIMSGDFLGFSLAK